MSFWSGKKVFVTGVSGLIGQHLLAHLSELGAELALFTHSSIIMPTDIPNYNKFKGDISNKQDIETALVKFPADLVIHLAAQSQTSNENIRDTFQTNTLGTLNLFGAVSAVRPNASVILASSIAVQFPDNMYAPSTYAASKQCAEIIAQNYSAARGINCMVIRLGNTYGPGDHHNQRLVPSLIQAMLNKEKIQLRSNIDTETNLLYVEDAVNGFLLVGEYLLQDKRLYSALTLCANMNVTTRELVSSLSKILDLSANVALNENLSLKVAEHAILPSELLVSTLGWQPKVKMSDGLEQTVNYYRQTLNIQGTD